jgi:hypothetical protein
MPQNSAQPQNLIAQNRQLRAALLASAPPFRKKLGNFASTSILNPPDTRAQLFNVGITTGLVLDVIASVTIGTAIATAGNKAPYTLLTRVRLTDFDGTDRVNVSGFQLYMINSVRVKAPYGVNNGSLASTLAMPVTPTAIGTANIEFQIRVPLAYSSQDLRGALLTQTAVGQAWLTVSWNQTLYTNGNDDCVYSGAATTTAVYAAAANFNCGQEYLLPQAVNGKVPLPTLDLMTVYELAGYIRDNANLAIGLEKLINYPNVRSVIGAYVNYLNNGVMQSLVAGMTNWRVLANGNNTIKEYTAVDKMFDMREQSMIEQADLKVGAWYELHRDKPIETALFGNIQGGFTPLLYTAGNTNLEIAFESFYTKGSTLPGMVQT